MARLRLTEHQLRKVVRGLLKEWNPSAATTASAAGDISPASGSTADQKPKDLPKTTTAQPDCISCDGAGFTGWLTEDGEPVPCPECNADEELLVEPDIDEDEDELEEWPGFPLPDASAVSVAAFDPGETNEADLDEDDICIGKNCWSTSSTTPSPAKYLDSGITVFKRPPALNTKLG